MMVPKKEKLKATNLIAFRLFIRAIVHGIVTAY